MTFLLVANLILSPLWALKDDAIALISDKAHIPVLA